MMVGLLLAAAQIQRFATQVVTKCTQTYSLDKNIVSYLLSGELWTRAHFNLLRVKPALTLICREHGKDNAPAYDSELEISIAAYEWSLLHANQVKLVMPPTVTLELARAPQVSTFTLCIYD